MGSLLSPNTTYFADQANTLGYKTHKPIPEMPREGPFFVKVEKFFKEKNYQSLLKNKYVT